MLTKYELVNVPPGGVDHLLNGVRVRISSTLTNQQAEALINAGCRYFKPIQTTLPNGQTQSRQRTQNKRGTNPRNKSGQFTSKS